MLYLQRKFPEHTFDVLHAGQKINALEKDFSGAKQLMESEDAVLFSYPVYTFLAPSQLHRFHRADEGKRCVPERKVLHPDFYIKAFL